MLALSLAPLLWAGPAAAAKIACVGDSITFGYGLSDPDAESYPAILQELVGAEHVVKNFGVSGATLQKSADRPYWNETRFGDSTAFAPDVVLLMLGTNDAKPQNWTASATFTQDYRELIDHYRTLGAVVYLATPARVFEPGAFEISPSVVQNELVPLVEDLALTERTPLVDVFLATGNSAELFPDTVHPNAQGARLLAEAFAAALVVHKFDAESIPASGGTGNAAGGTGADGDLGTGGTAPSSGGALIASGAGGSTTAGGGSVAAGGWLGDTNTGGTGNVATGGAASPVAPASGGNGGATSSTSSGGASDPAEAVGAGAGPGEGTAGCQIAWSSPSSLRELALGALALLGFVRARRRRWATFC